MRVATPPTDPQAVYNTRTFWPAEALGASRKIKVVKVPDSIRVRHAVRRSGPPEPVGIKNFPDCDVIVITRPLAGPLVEMIPFLQRRGIAVVVDIDDDFRHTLGVFAWRDKIDPVKSPKYNWKVMARACAMADLVTCSTDALKRYAPHGRVRVLRNCVPEAYLELEAPRSDQKIVGWGGTVIAHPGDLQVTHGGVGKAVKDNEAQFLVVGKADGVQKALDLDEEPADTGLVSHEDYAANVARFDVGIAPLAENAYTTAKSWIKPLEYQSMGIPWVGSPTPEYARLAGEWAESNSPAPGALASPRSRDWSREVQRMLRRPENEAQEAKEFGQQIVRELHVIESQCWRWEEAWADARENRLKAKAA